VSIVKYDMTSAQFRALARIAAEIPDYHKEGFSLDRTNLQNYTVLALQEEKENGRTWLITASGSVTEIREHKSR